MTPKSMLKQIPAGIALITIAIAYSKGNTSICIIILLGPIPITLGAEPQAPLLIALAAVLTIVGIAAYLLMRRTLKKTDA